MSGLWESPGSLTDNKIVWDINIMENVKYSSIVEDISLEDEDLCCAVERIDHE